MAINEGFEKVALTGQVIIVTGGGSGMGEATAKLIARRGARVAVVDINEAGGTATVEAIRAGGGDAEFFRVDVTVELQVAGLIGDVVARFGRLDGAFNNAGIIGPNAVIDKFSYEDWRKVLTVNLDSVFLCMKYEIAYFREQGRGAIVNTSSTAGQIAYPNLPAYVASKHGVVGLTRQVGVDVASEGIRVNAVLPGSTLTPLAAESFADPEVKAKAESVQPIGRLGVAEEIAELAAWLLSDAASFVTASAYFVDGGVNAA
ncbi:SDR family oxidoreductase [Cryobacterium sp. TMS1-20-1]|uniref:SDR family NAD(P)-dependent oxidoreductase n=1 Tax=Cryobacterium sp. TMS1-20-1 TaxID=1259223 RepID=UPI00106A444E|nr:SDR family oxidoreductase [Cryobacterium sp. TMS1-20-1]TFC80556.1 SDR family oxidoreductase [Cryobacterium sp. TMS1-20-1]